MKTIINIDNHNIVLEPPNIYPKMKCSVIGCYNVKKARGLCDKHLARFYRHGNTNKPIHKGNNIINKYDDYAEVCIKENIKILIDLEDVEKVSKYTWFMMGDYPGAHINKTSISMHNYILNRNTTDRTIVCDHINGNKLDNRKSNLRICSVSENSFNTKNHREGKCGVRKHVQKGKYVFYQAYISVDSKQINLGYFPSEFLARQARKEAEIKYNINPKTN